MSHPKEIAGIVLAILVGGLAVYLAMDRFGSTDEVPAIETRTFETALVKRVVTGIDSAGKSVFVSAGKPKRVVTLGNITLLQLWANDDSPSLPDDSLHDETPITFQPKPGGIRFNIATINPIDPDQAPPDPAGNQAEASIPEEFFAGLNGAMEPHDSGMHTTDTIDFVVVLSGKGDLELDDGATVHLGAGDTVIQRGTRHAWRNTGSEPFVLAAVLLGAERR